MDRDLRIRRIHEAIGDIPPGRVASYGQIGDIAGLVRGARQVVHALRHVPDGMDLPWHRVVRSSGRIAFPPDSPQFRKQRDRLRDEGVAVDAGRIDMARFRWQPDLDELLWKPSAVWDDV